MKALPIVPARIDFSDASAPFATEFGDVYHSRAGALAQARHVFLAGNGLPGRWQGRTRFVVLETGFGLGNNFLATWEAWRADPARSERLVFISVEKHPPLQADLRRAHAASTLQPLADELVAAWPPLVHNLHAIDLDGGRVQLMLAFGDVGDWLPELVAEVDAFYLDGFAPARNPQMWDRRLLKAIGRLAAPEATAATWSVAREVRDGLVEAGFQVERAPGFASKADMTIARYAPAFTPRRAPSRRVHQAHVAHEAIVIGAGIAGCCTAAALAAEGFGCTLIDRQASPANEASGNPGGMFHGILTPEDGAHARFNRAAALQAARLFGPMVRRGEAPGRVDGLLRLHGAEEDFDSLQALPQRMGMPADFVQAVDAQQASALAGLPVSRPGWFYPGGGWVSPAAAVARLLDTRTRFIGQTTVQSLRQVPEGWQALDAEGHVIAQAPVVVVANARDAMRLLQVDDWPMQRVRGQVTVLQTSWLPERPMVGAGYAISIGGGRLLCGSSNQQDDEDPTLREADHQANLAQLATLAGQPVLAQGPLDGRVGWRLCSTDRLPVLGPLPEPGIEGIDQPRKVPRRAGLFALAAMGYRGLVTAPLAARTLAAWIAGSPLPMEASLLDAVDAARFISRAARR